MTSPSVQTKSLMNNRVIHCGLAAAACARALTGFSQIFVTTFASGFALDGTVGEYTTSGAPVNPELISGLGSPDGISVSGDKLFVKNGDRVSEYTTSGVLV